MRNNIRADIKSIALQLNISKLGFASERRLQSILGVQKGAVSPLGIVNDINHSVAVVFDSGLKGSEKLGVHPNDNSATVWLSLVDLERLISHYGNTVYYINI
jgi:Ala-tRNA(Pro) deacylase